MGPEGGQTQLYGGGTHDERGLPMGTKWQDGLRSRAIKAGMILLGLLMMVVGGARSVPVSAAGFASASLDNSNWTVTTTLDDGNPDLNAVRAAIMDGDSGTAWTSTEHQTP
jgi:hypothetical protein